MMEYYAWRRGGDKIVLSVKYDGESGRWYVLGDGERIKAGMSFREIRYIYKYDAVEHAKELKKKLVPKYDTLVFKVFGRDGRLEKEERFGE